MVAVRVLNQKGVIPALSDELLPKNYASDAQDVKLRSGMLTPFRATLPITKLAKIGTKKTIYRWGAIAGGDIQGVVSAATKTNPVSLTSAGHGLITGDQIYLFFILGMIEINKKEFTVTVTGVNSFTLNGEDGTSYTTYISGGTWVKKNGHFFHWLTDVDVIKGSLANDSIERTYFTGDGVPKMTYSPIAETGGDNYPNNSYELGIPIPGQSPTASVIINTGTIIDITTDQNNLSSTVLVKLPDSSHGLIDGNFITINNILGTTELNGNQYLIKVIGASNDYIELYDLSGNVLNFSNYSTYISGGTWEQTYSKGSLIERFYVMTYVSALGEEGAASKISNIISVGPGQSVTFVTFNTSPTGNFNISTKRIYKSNKGTSDGEVFFTAEIPVSTTVFTDSQSGQALSGKLKTDTWIQPPSDMGGIISLPNGIAAGFTKNSLCLSEPYLPHAWPSNYRPPTDYDIVAIANFDNVIVVGTRGNPYVCYATDPASAVLKEIKNGQACVSKRSMVSIGDQGVAYAGPYGLVVISASGTRLATKEYLEPEQWKALNPESINAIYFDGKYYAFYDDGTSKAGFIFDPSSSNSDAYMPISIYSDAIWVDVETGYLYITIGDEVHRWDSGEDVMAYFYETKAFRTSSPINPGVGRVIAESYNDTTFKLYSDDVLVHSQAVVDDTAFMLPDGYLAERFKMRIDSKDKVKQIILAETMDDVSSLPNV